LANDLRDPGETCRENRVAHLANHRGIAAQIVYKRCPGLYGDQPAVVIGNALDRQFKAAALDTVWETDILYIKAHEGWQYMAVMIDLFSQRAVGWSA
jgi:putative transposase